MQLRYAMMTHGKTVFIDGICRCNRNKYTSIDAFMLCGFGITQVGEQWLILQLVLYSTKQHFSSVCANAVIWQSDSNYIGKVFIRLIRANKFRLEM